MSARPSRLADFYIIGSMKCATSTLHEQLATRSAFFMSEPKEPNFFNREEEVKNGLEAYEQLFRRASDKQITGESSTHYTKEPTYKGTAARIWEHTPDARFVYVMRDPLERMASQYMHEWTERQIDVSFSKAVQRYERYVAYSSYARQLRPFIRLFGKSRILPVFFEQLVAFRLKELERIAQFLGDSSGESWAWSPEVSHANISNQRLRKSAFRDRVLSFSITQHLKDALPEGVSEKIKSIWRINQRPTLNSSVRMEVSRRLNTDLDELGMLLGLKLNCENFSEVAKVTTPIWAP